MKVTEALPALAELHQDSTGDQGIVIAILDGPVDLDHPALREADLSRLDTLVSDPPGPGLMSRHGTHVTSLVFGQPDSGVPGVAPRCRGLILPVFHEAPRRRLAQLDLARAIERAVEAGAHVINVSGGELSPTGEPDDLLRRALQRCAESNVAVVAAAGNDGCECLHVPAAFPTVLAVGAADHLGRPLTNSNWGTAYRQNAIHAPGADIEGAVPGGGTAAMTGSSFAAPLVSGVLGLLLSYQLRHGVAPDPNGLAELLRDSAAPCLPDSSAECRRHHRGFLNIPAARAALTERTDLMTEVSNQTPSPSASGALPPGAPPDALPEAAGAAPSGAPQAGSGGGTPTPGSSAARRAETAPGPAAVTPAGPAGEGVVLSGTVIPPAAAAPGGSGTVTPSCSGAAAPSHSSEVRPSCSGVTASCGCAGAGTGAGKSLVYALGQIGFDFGTEARRDTFRQLMPSVLVQRQEAGSTTDQLVAPNPYAIDQLTDYLNSRPSESTKLIWTLNLDLTPIYAVEAEAGPYGDEVYEVLRTALRCSALDPSDPEYISRVSIPGRLTNRTVRLYSGQELPVVVAQPRGLYAWQEAALVDTVVHQLRGNVSDGEAGRQWTDDQFKNAVRIFLQKIYFQLRNLGSAPADRALNYAGTNAFMFFEGIAEGLASGSKVPGGANVLYTLDTISVAKSPYCRLDSSCWDVVISFFDPENERRARVVYQYTIDVSDAMPVSLTPAHQYLAT